MKKLFLIMLFLMMPFLSMSFQMEGTWQPLELLYESPQIERPVAVADRYGGAHLFWWGLTSNQEKDEPTGILYSYWDGQQWSIPVDILVSPNRERTFSPEVAIDSLDIIHVVWGGAHLYYSSASLGEAGNPAAWSRPLSIGEDKSVASTSSIAVDSEDNLHVVFSESGRDVYHVVSFDHGHSWHRSVAISSVPKNITTLMAHLAIDDKNCVHVTWSQATLPNAYPPEGVFYSRSCDDGETWSDPIQLAGENYGESNILVDKNQLIHVVYNGRVGVGGRYHRWSSDGGRTWSDVIEIVSPKESSAGLTGEPCIVGDLIGRVHFIGADALYSVWDGKSWSRFISLRSSSPLSSYMEFPALVISGGNRLHAVFWSERVQLWTTWKLLDIPGSQLPRPVELNSTVRPTLEGSGVQTITPQTFIYQDSVPETPSLTTGFGLIAGASVSALLLLFVFAMAFRKRGGL